MCSPGVTRRFFQPPAELSLASIVGWLNAFVGIVTLSRVISAATLFFKASQWFDAMSPKIVGLLRHAMYKLSDNYEYLGSKKQDPEKRRGATKSSTSRRFTLSSEP